MSSELGDFLRASRERLTPEEVGLRPGRHRRTPGLRREEVAALAGISIEYLIRLEQGRDSNPSAAVLAALSDTLRLSEPERRHLGMLSIHANQSPMCPEKESPTEEVAPTLVQTLQHLEPAPAAIVGPFGDLLAWNGQWTRLVAPMGLLDGPRPNLARYVFVHPAAQKVFPDWADLADQQASLLRPAAAWFADDTRMQSLMAELHAVEGFDERWNGRLVAEERSGALRISHPVLGDLRVNFETLLLGTQWPQRLLVWLAGDEATSRAFTDLAAEPAPVVRTHRLRVVGD
jgi:transcriptional regulator with XRE-family HTH domain